MPKAARIGDDHTCPMADPKPHKGGAIKTGAGTVIIGDEKAARVTDLAICVGPLDAISEGSPTVIIEGHKAARIFDSTLHKGMITSGCGTVIIGDTGQGATLRAAAQDGTPFCEVCEKARRKGP
jgi:uncharacterized Zn-binding protein involved in type VI secretion